MIALAQHYIPPSPTPELLVREKPMLVATDVEHPAQTAAIVPPLLACSETLPGVVILEESGIVRIRDIELDSIVELPGLTQRCLFCSE